ncbi:hypothetical protein OBBRIDRAFT_786341 [Obba rivulosa]|uniref:Uncharacterized protein n=1 Tax=Obba rivulosa TaxID=1052685 RepID=A0A8E2AL71_9APHY|nr:hypothetical protein OBBRIDRAFT_786341 [Obba rivulosa]
MTECKTYSPQYLWDELMLHPLLLCLGSLSLSMLMSRLIFGVLDWRPVTITVASDILAIGIDHYFDHGSSLAFARKTGDLATLSVFAQARLMLITSTVVLGAALLCSPPLTWAMVIIFFGPACIWDFNLLRLFEHRMSNEFGEGRRTKRKLSVKRIPGIKNVIVGIIRGGGTFAVVYSVLEPMASSISSNSQIWTAEQIVIWSIVNRGCHSVMGDIRDFHDDQEKQVPTIPVLLNSVYKCKILLTALHMLVSFAYIENPYIVFASFYASTFVWILDTDTPRKLFHFSFQSQTIVGLVYYIVQCTR